MRTRICPWLPLLLSLGGAFLFLLAIVPYLNAHPSPYRSVGGVPAIVGAALFSVYVGSLTFAANQPGRLRLAYSVGAAAVSACVFLVLLLVAYLFLYGLQ